ncbi:histamine N-methyltransferase-like [Nelusetta ayraudi]|uniref:histamine N-methyltransferase-like n=1 Tax=Nelusetta ayraudi TaxID=303726 RepID=UPI003F7133A7
MEDTTRKTCYEGTAVQDFKLFRERSRELVVIVPCLREILHQEFNRTGSDKNILDVLGVGSGGGELDVPMLTVLHSKLPDILIRAEIVEGSNELTSHFKALISKTPNLQKIPFVWNSMRSEEYMSRVKATGDVKKFDFIHMIHMIYYVDDLAETISFYHSLLKDDGRLLILLSAEKNGWDTLWKTCQKDWINRYCSSGEVIACAKSLGLKYKELSIPNQFDITDCFDPSSQTGKGLLNFITAKDNFYESLTPEIRSGILDLLRHKCSTEKDGRVMFDSKLSCILIHA